MHWHSYIEGCLARPPPNVEGRVSTFFHTRASFPLTNPLSAFTAEYGVCHPIVYGKTRCRFASSSSC